MGTFDRLIRPSTYEEMQTKTLGKMMRTHYVGNAAAPTRRPVTMEEYASFQAGDSDITVTGLVTTMLQVLVDHRGRDVYLDTVGGWHHHSGPRTCDDYNHYSAYLYRFQPGAGSPTGDSR